MDQLRPTKLRTWLARLVANLFRRCTHIHIRHSLAIAALSSAVTALVLLGALLAWHLYAGWRLGRIELTTEGAPLRVQVFRESGDEPIGDAFDVAERAVLSLPAGDYRLRITGNGRLGRRARFAVNRGELLSYPLSLDEGRLLGADVDPSPLVRHVVPERLPYRKLTAALELKPGKSRSDRAVG